jgi:hypothetical protein
VSETPLEHKSEAAGALGAPVAERERNLLPLMIAAGVVLLVVAVALIVGGRRKPAEATAISAAPDSYAASLPLSDLAMSESANLAGGKVTYIDGHIANHGDRTVTGITVQVLFRNYAREVAQNETMAMSFIRMRDPYIDTEPVSAAPLKPGAGQDFRLIFDNVSPDWAGAMPEIRVLRVESK